MKTTLPHPVHVYFVVLEHALALDIAGPAEALRIANHVLQEQGLPPAFVPHFVAPARQVHTSVGLTAANLEIFPQQLATPAWVVVPGLAGRQPINPRIQAHQALIRWLRNLAWQEGACELVTVCAGSIFAAYAGLLNDRQATTHHHNLDELAQIAPGCKVQHHRIFVQDGPVASSAGVTTGIDLMVHKVAQLCGERIAAEVAQWLVMPLRRSTHDTQASPFLAYRHHLHPALHRLQDAVCANPAADWRISRMAEVACISPRHLARLFATHAGIAPLQWLRHIRLAAARHALQAGCSVMQAAQQAGFSSDQQLRRTWRQAGLAGYPAQGRRAD